MVVGAGISGLSAAHFFRKRAGPQARVLRPRQPRRLRRPRAPQRVPRGRAASYVSYGGTLRHRQPRALQRGGQRLIAATWASTWRRWEKVARPQRSTRGLGYSATLLRQGDVRRRRLRRGPATATSGERPGARREALARPRRCAAVRGGEARPARLRRRSASTPWPGSRRRRRRRGCCG